MEMNIISFDLGQPSVGHKSLFQQRITIKDMVHKICHYIWKGVRGNKKQQSQNHQQTCIGLLPKKKKNHNITICFPVLCVHNIDCRNFNRCYEIFARMCSSHSEITLKIEMIWRLIKTYLFSKFPQIINVR